MSERIVVEQECQHGFTNTHYWGGPPLDPDWRQFPEKPNCCTEGRRRVLTAGEFVRVASAALYEQLPSAVGGHRGFAEHIATRILDALAKSEQEGTE